MFHQKGRGFYLNTISQETKNRSFRTEIFNNHFCQFRHRETFFRKKMFSKGFATEWLLKIPRAPLPIFFGIVSFF